LVDSVGEKHFQVFISEELIAELADVISRAKFAGRIVQLRIPPDQPIPDSLRDIFHVIPVLPMPGAVPNDPDDDAVIACAVAAQADYIISGDRHLLSLGEFQGIKICTAEHFLNVVMPNLPA